MTFIMDMIYKMHALSTNKQNWKMQHIDKN